MVRPIVNLSDGSRVFVKGIDYPFEPYPQNTLAGMVSPEAAVIHVANAIAGGRTIWNGEVWTYVNPDHVISVTCRSFDG